MIGLAPWETHSIVFYAVGDIVSRRDDPETVAKVIELRSQHIVHDVTEYYPWPMAICVRRRGRHGVMINEWWRSESADLLSSARMVQSSSKPT